MEVSQVCAYANWANESIEVWKWCAKNKPRKDIVREMKSLFLIVYAQVVPDKCLEELEEASCTIGMTDLAIQVTDTVLRKIGHTAFFARYRGKCLDEKRLQYFAPDKILTKGTLFVDRNRVIVTPLTREDKKENEKVELEENSDLDTDEANTNRLLEALGEDWNYLFDWKASFRT